MGKELRKLTMDKTYWPIEKLRNWDKNPRAIDKGDYTRLKKQIQELGEYKPLLVTPDGEVLGGNMRLKAYQELGKGEVWVSVVDAKTEAEKLKYALSDNDRAGYYVEQDLAELIQANLGEIELGDYKVDLGKPVDLDQLLSQFGPEIEEDEVPEVTEGEPESKLGEVYQLGRHRLMCGDATKLEDVEKLMGGQKADMVFTDPPYGIEYEGGMKKWEMIKNDDDLSFLPDTVSNMYIVQKINAPTYICFNDRGIDVLMASLKDKYQINKLLIWVKNNSSFQISAHYKQKHEVILYLKRKDESLTWYGPTTEVTTWEIDRASANEFHPTQKPVSLCARAVKNSSKKDDIVLDLFGGSGSTLIACEQLNRTCYMMELDPKYCDVIRKRYENFTKKENG